MNFEDILDTKLEDVERPPLPPKGNYIFKVSKVPEFGESKDGRWKRIDIPCQAIQPIDDLDLEGMKPTDINLRVTFMFSTDQDDDIGRQKSQNRLKNFLERHLCVEGAEKMSLREALSHALNHQFIGVLDWRDDPNDPEIKYPEIARTAPTED